MALVVRLQPLTSMLLKMGREGRTRRFCLTKGFFRPTQCLFLVPEYLMRIEFRRAQTAQCGSYIGVLTCGEHICLG